MQRQETVLTTVEEFFEWWTSEVLTAEGVVELRALNDEKKKNEGGKAPMTCPPKVGPDFERVLWQNLGLN